MPTVLYVPIIIIIRILKSVILYPSLVMMMSDVYVRKNFMIGWELLKQSTIVIISVDGFLV
jgi:hypothetical protein